ncbi:MAG TPA: class I adenylate-forming enzyme family protein, partial [Candidatus Limnocylindria bacterium]|nr:class I adenylate-forming enzyme family protein [Candidatus Limnocylindria bacterium]
METLIDLLDRSAERYGDRPALVIKPGFRTRVWRYGDIAELVPRVAGVLRRAGVEPGDRVLIWAVNRPEWGIAFLGVAYAGGVSVPLDVRTTDELAAKVAGATRPKLVLASQPTLQQASRLELPALAVESLVDVARDAEPLPRPTPRPDDLLEVVFTSGTTGEPKGAMLTHRNIVSNAAAVQSVVPLGPETRLLSILPLSHMYGQNPGFLAPLIAGASVVYPTSLQPLVLARTVRENRVTMLLMVPQALKLLTNAVERRVDAAGKRAAFERLHRVGGRLPLRLRRLVFRPVLKQFGGDLRYVAVGGAALNPNVARRWEEMGVDVLQGYGATEASPVIAFTRLDRNVIGTVGQVVPGVDVRIAPDGEVLVRGPNVFAGYWERPDATEVVLRDGWYHTGDHGTLDSDGFLTLRGRKKDMLAMPDGTKVYPDDVEAAIVRDPRVREAAVVGLERRGGDVQVHAVLVVSDPADAGDVIRGANARLGAHQQIRGHSVWPEDDLPRTPSLKVRKNVLLDWLQAEQRDAAATPREAPVGTQTAAERLVAQIESVALDAVRPEARLSSDLGLDSLGRVELLGLIEEELGVYLDEDALDPDATLGELQAMIDAAAGERREQGILAWPLNP